MSKSVFLACVVDNLPRLHVELVLWTICASRVLPREYFRPIVYFVGDQPEDLCSWVRAQGIETRVAVPLIAGSPHCNKIIPFFEAVSETIIAVCDVDLFFVADPSGIFDSNRFCAPPNNHCNPPPFIWKNVLSATGLGFKYQPGVSLLPSINGLRETHANNISAGLVTSPTKRAGNLAHLWRKWASWLVENRSLLQSWAVHVDQMGLSLALEEMEEKVSFLPPQANTILHFLDAVESVYAFHLTTGHIPQFPERFNPDKTLSSQGIRPEVVPAIEMLNGCIRKAVDVVNDLPSTRDHSDKFLNPAWIR